MVEPNAAPAASTERSTSAEVVLMRAATSLEAAISEFWAL